MSEPRFNFMALPAPVREEIRALGQRAREAEAERDKALALAGTASELKEELAKVKEKARRLERRNLDLAKDNERLERARKRAEQEENRAWDRLEKLLKEGGHL